MHSEKILLVDDQRSHLRLMKRMLEKYGWEAVTVDSAEEAELILEWENDFPAMITDLKMPWLDGVSFCKKVRQKFPDMKIFALSGNLAAYDFENLVAAGFDGIYQKPIRMEILEVILYVINAKTLAIG